MVHTRFKANEAMSGGAGRGGDRDHGGAQDNGADGRIFVDLVIPILLVLLHTRCRYSVNGGFIFVV